MKSTSLQEKIQEIIMKNELTEVRYIDVPNEFKVAYILDFNDACMTLAEFDEQGNPDGISMYPTDIFASVSTQTRYLARLQKKINSSALDEAKKLINPIQTFSFSGMAQAFAGTDTLVEILYKGNYKPAGKIISCDEDSLLLNEYSDENVDLEAQILIKTSLIERMSLAIPYMSDIVETIKK